jgi:hypothetical protein
MQTACCRTATILGPHRRTCTSCQLNHRTILHPRLPKSTTTCINCSLAWQITNLTPATRIVKSTTFSSGFVPCSRSFMFYSCMFHWPQVLERSGPGRLCILHILARHLGGSHLRVADAALWLPCFLPSSGRPSLDCHVVHLDRHRRAVCWYVSRGFCL